MVGFELQNCDPIEYSTKQLGFEGISFQDPPIILSRARTDHSKGFLTHKFSSVHRQWYQVLHWNQLPD